MPDQFSRTRLLLGAKAVYVLQHARVMRRELKKRNVKHLKVVYSTEEALTPLVEEEDPVSAGEISPDVEHISKRRSTPGLRRVCTFRRRADHRWRSDQGPHEGSAERITLNMHEFFTDFAWKAVHTIRKKHDKMITVFCIRDRADAYVWGENESTIKSEGFRI